MVAALLIAVCILPTLASCSRNLQTTTVPLLRDLQGHTAGILSVSYNPDGSQLASGSRDSTVKIWDVETGTQLLSLAHSDAVKHVDYSPDGTKVVSSSSDTLVYIWNATSGGIIRTLPGHTGNVYSVKYSPDGSRICSSASDGTVKLWNASTGNEIWSVTAHSGWGISEASFSPDGTRIVTASDEGTAKVLNVTSGNSILTLDAATEDLPYVWNVAYSPDGSLIATGLGQIFGTTGAVKVWGAQTGGLLYTLEGHTSGVNSVAFDPSGKYLASGAEDNTIILWSIGSGQPALLFTNTGHRGYARAVEFSPNGKYLASGSEDAIVKVWDVSSIVNDSASPLGTPEPSTAPPTPDTGTLTPIPIPQEPTTPPAVPLTSSPVPPPTDTPETTLTLEPSEAEADDANDSSSGLPDFDFGLCAEQEKSFADCLETNGCDGSCLMVLDDCCDVDALPDDDAAILRGDPCLSNNDACGFIGSCCSACVQQAEESMGCAAVFCTFDCGSVSGGFSLTRCSIGWLVVTCAALFIIFP